MSFANVAFTGEETKNISGAGGHELLTCFTHSLLRVFFYPLDGAILPLAFDIRGPVPNFNGVGSSRDLDNGCRISLRIRKVVCEFFRVDRRGGDNDLEIWASWQ